MSRAKALQYYILTRLFLAPLMLWTIATVVFLLLRATPGDPVDVILGPRAVDESVKAELRAQLGLDQPLGLQYLHYLWGLLQFDLGTSLTTRGQAVSEIILEFFPATVELAVFSMIIALVVGIGVGSFAASRPNTVWDAGGRIFGIITYAVPAFWAGMLVQLIFAVQLRWFPLGLRFPTDGLPPPPNFTGLYTLDSLLAFLNHASLVVVDLIQRPSNVGLWMGQVGLNLSQLGTTCYYLTLPCLTLGILMSGMFERVVRVNLKQTLKADYVEAARARGIPERRIVLVHALRNALIPVITLSGLTLAGLLGGALLTEVTFSWPGLANRLYQAISQRDYPTVQGIMVFFAGIVVLASLAIDILNAWIDPRIRY